MYPTFMPSLMNIVLVKIVSSVWNCKYLNDTHSDWKEIKEQIREKVSLLLLPKILKEKLAYSIRPLYDEVWKWTRDKRRCDMDESFLDELFWTPQGTLDRKKMAEAKIRDVTIDITKRFMLACNYCLKNDVRALWERISESRRISFLTENRSRSNRAYIWPEYQFNQNPMVLFWTEDVKGEEAEMEKYIDYFKQHNRDLNRDGYTLYQYAFEDSVMCGNKVAAEYFWNKLAPEEKKYSLRLIAPQWTNIEIVEDADRDTTDILPFLLSQMNEEQQLEMFKTCPLAVLVCFLEWPRQNMFMEMTNHVWEFLKDEDYYWLLDKLAEKICEAYKDFDYEEHFKFIWKKTDIAHKKYVINKCVREKLLFYLFDVKCTELIALIFKDATVEEKENIFFHKKSYLCRRLVRNKEWDLLKFFISECVPSREKMLKFKDKCKKRRWTKDMSNEDLQIFFELLDDFIEKWNEKRSTEQKNSSKRLCSSSNE